MNAIYSGVASCKKNISVLYLVKKKSVKAEFLKEKRKGLFEGGFKKFFAKSLIYKGC